MADTERKQMLAQLRARVREMQKKGVPKEHILTYVRAWKRTDERYQEIDRVAANKRREARAKTRADKEEEG